MALNLGKIKVVLLDIEGTVCPISFVKDVLVRLFPPPFPVLSGAGSYPDGADPVPPTWLDHSGRVTFPHAVNALPATLDNQWDSPDFSSYRNAFPEDCVSDRSAFEAHFRDLVNRDVKVSYLKALQGYLWNEGYESGDIKAPLFPDVAERLLTWKNAGLRLVVYSSGSVPAQKLFFAHTDAQPSDLTHLISGWFDTVNAGLKTEPSSYTNILSNFQDAKACEWLFLSDNPLEVSAAIAAGMQSIPVVRPGNAPLPIGMSPRPISDFKELEGLGSKQS
ncbi:2, 3-diketo-5-methylthio-1-phosphopentane phosphatase [Colletotrichum karsti]|uniref:2, 3-diketo-5-methylthio-1-phosphopentane phosphatase n=1 Tax=Colletotrichum karsti TaxID=1095194 RepID=A0A9P6LGN3_9PEZI|nr:2, 3-diketo-5-methylthio-1-phosphopentane phosphatase [Colletotrichum karsti]KAF9871607.1 2, 3-diketo-5-methylthio-1-phosphopentane phosphatase [Colletotrichum karsti]